ncbi:MAG: TetR/AcrR family transcriptional regulator [Proteobacteria bacterium]|nr:TetR/AcrR family transcriptional regulator [Pseudomonadota bacterium]
MFARRGFNGVGLREVADGAGLGKSSLFHHFRGKVHLYTEVVSNVFGRLEERLGPALNSERSASEKLEMWVESLIDELAEHPPTARLLLRGLVEDDDFLDPEDPDVAAVEQQIARLVLGFERILKEGIASGAFRSVSVPDATQTLIGATVYHFASGEFGEGLMGGPLFSAAAVRRRKQEVLAFLRHGFSAPEAETNAPTS